MVLTERDPKRREHASNGAEALTNADIAVLSFPIAAAPDMPLALRNVFDRVVDRPGGASLTQSPFDPEEYAPTVPASEQFELAKHMVVPRLCQLPGAKTSSIEQIHLRPAIGSAPVATRGRKGQVKLVITAEQQKVEAFRD